MKAIIGRSDPASVHPFWRLGFRCGFLCAGCYAVLAVLLWILWLQYGIGLPAALPPHWWHAHEMLFGFAMPVVVGFLLTAVQAWTGIPGTVGWRLQLIFGCWLAARLILLLWPQAAAVAMACDTLLLLGALIEVGSRVLSCRQWRNAPLIVLLLLFAVLNVASYRALHDPLLASRLHLATLYLFLVLIAVVGGRVIPFFTARRLELRQVPGIPVLEVTALISLLATALLAGLGKLPSTAVEVRVLLVVSALLHLWRLLRWQGWLTLRIPLLWSLHLAYLCIPLGLLTMALPAADTAARHYLHLFAVGAVGGMILAMMARVSLGHTGRALEVSGAMTLAFALVLVAALLRAFLPPVLPEATRLAWLLSSALWLLAYGLFVLRYFRILCSARPDGRVL